MPDETMLPEGTGPSVAAAATNTAHAETRPQAGRVLTTVQAIVFLVFGLLVPSALVYQSSTFIGGLAPSFKLETTAQVSENYGAAVAKIHGVNEFLLYTYLQAERANFASMVNKQAMKCAVINIGFAVVSIGILLLVLGIKGEGGLTLSSGSGGVKFDLATGSAGLAIFVLGAIMACVGGVLPNDYQTVGIPRYLYVGDASIPVVVIGGADVTPIYAGAAASASKEEEGLANYRYCETQNAADGREKARCFINRYHELYSKELEQ